MPMDSKNAHAALKNGSIAVMSAVEESPGTRALNGNRQGDIAELVGTKLCTDTRMVCASSGLTCIATMMLARPSGAKCATGMTKISKWRRD